MRLHFYKASVVKLLCVLQLKMSTDSSRRSRHIGWTDTRTRTHDLMPWTASSLISMVCYQSYSMVFALEALRNALYKFSTYLLTLTKLADFGCFLFSVHAHSANENLPF